MTVHRYSEEGDLLIGDLIVVGDIKLRMIQAAADDIDSELGGLYETPITSTLRHETLLLKRISNLIASGRLIMALATKETSERHSYGAGLLKEGKGLLCQLADLSVTLFGATEVARVTRTNAPNVSGQDETSAVDFFYGVVSGTDTDYSPWTPGAA
ncbi:MAG: hypothetical protein AB7O86_05780 [Porticoccaceae bacterium]